MKISLKIVLITVFVILLFVPGFIWKDLFEVEKFLDYYQLNISLLATVFCLIMNLYNKNYTLKQNLLIIILPFAIAALISSVGYILLINDFLKALHVLLIIIIFIFTISAILGSQIASKIH